MTLNTSISSMKADQADSASPPSTSSPSPTLAQSRNLRFTGLISPEKIESLRARFGHVVVCPGFVGQFGRKVDDWGRIFVPGATDSDSEAKRIWTRWEKECSNELYSWWPEAMQERGIKPITCNDILNGVLAASWQGYRKSYIRCCDARLQRRRRARLRDEACDRAAEDTPADAASSLLKLGGAASKY